MELRPYQIEAARWLAKRQRGMLVAPAGAGKTIIAAAALDELVAKFPERVIRVGWIANTKEQVEQGWEAIANFPSLGSHFIRIACAAGEEEWGDVDVLIVDECHHAAAKTWHDQIKVVTGIRWGMTATPSPASSSEPERKEIVEELFGGPTQVFRVEREEAAHALAPARVTLLDETDPGLRAAIDAEIANLQAKRRRWWRGSPGELYAICSWHACGRIGMVENNARNQAALRKATEHVLAGDRVLVLVNQVEHGELFVAHVPSSKLCHSKMGAKRRRLALDAFREGTCRCLIATSLADEGLDLPMANVLVLVSGGKSQTKAEQRTGRVLRVWAGKTHGRIYDFVDGQHPTMEKHAKARVALYRELGYRIDGEQGTLC